MDAYTPPTPLNVERANRLLNVKAMPGFIEIMRISAGLVEQATANLVNFGGWDKDQVMVLKARAQAASEHHKLLFTSIEEAIREGIAEASNEKSSLHSEITDDIVREVDRARVAAMTQGPDDDFRIPGSY